MPIRRSPNDARHPIHRVVAITRNRWSRSIGMTGRNQSERLVAIIRYAQAEVPGGLRRYQKPSSSHMSLILARAPFSSNPSKAISKSR